MADRSGAVHGSANCDSVANVLGDCILDNDSIILTGIQDTPMADLRVQPAEDELMLGQMVSAEGEMLHSSALPRKSDRERRERRSFSPEHQRAQGSGSTSGRRRKGTPRKLKKEDSGQQITCELCFSPYVTNPLNQHPTAKKSRYRPSWRTRVDRDTGKLMVLCNACGLAYDRPQKVSRARPQPAPEDKQRYLDEVRDFAASLVKELDDPDAERLACPHFKMEGCGCIQRYIMADAENVEESRKRAMELLGLLKQAKELSQKKFYDPEKVIEAEAKGMKRPRNIGLGNGQKRSKEFEEFILHTRKILRDELLLCERAAQRILMYSNNFLHKKLKTEDRSCRVERTKGKYVMGLLKPITALTREKCCTFRCVRMAVTLSSLLEEWRKRAASGQREARRVIAEMLTPSGGARPNCYNFIEMITGCSFSTIGKVNEQMRNSGGSREPPAHGMCHYWKKHPQKKRPRTGEQGDSGGLDSGEDEEKQSGVDESDGMPLDGTPSAEETAEAALSLDPLPVEIVPVSEVLVNNTEATTEEPVETPTTVTAVTAPKQLTSVELVNHRQQIMALQKQLAQQQVQLQQQQQLLQQQMLHQVLLDQVNGTSGVHIQTLQSLQQLLNLQQQYQQQQLQQLNQLEEQAGLIPGTSDAATSHTGTILGGAELLQLPPSLLAQLSEQQQAVAAGGLDAAGSQQQPVVLIQSMDTQQQQLLQQHPLVLQTGTDSLIAPTSQNDPSTAATTATSEEQEARSETGLGTGDAMEVETEKGNSVESLVQIPVPTSSSIILPTPTSLAGSKGSGGAALVQQVIDLGQLGYGIQSLNPTAHNNPITLLNADASQLLSSLNITLVQSPPGGRTNTTTAIPPPSTEPPSTTSTLTSVMSTADISEAPSGSVMGATDESLTQLLASSLGYTVLTIEPGMMVDGTTANTVDKVPADNPAFIDMDGSMDSETIAASADNSQVGKAAMLDVGLKVPGETETDGGEEAPSDMSTSEVLQLLAQHGIGITVAKADQ